MRNIKYLLVLILLGFLLASCEKEDNSVIDPVLHFPIITSTSITPQTFDSDTVNAVATANVTSVDPIGSVTVSIIDPKQNSKGSYNLHDDGLAPDQTAEDGIYSGYVFFVMECRIVGNNYSAKFIANTSSGLSSAEVNNSFAVTNSNNLPPVALNLIITPDSVRLGDPATLVYKINVTDPNGSCDISDVFYEGTNPNGGALTRQSLFDDGSCCPIPPFGPSGDSIAGDGIYTRIFNGSPTLPGYYVYHIKAVDNTGAESLILSDSIKVYQ